MAIEFRCVNCNKLLRVKEESAGKKAKCPECATVLEIPMPGAPPAGGDFEIEKPAETSFPNFAAELPPQRPNISANPYQSPAADDTGTMPGQGVGGAIINPTKLDVNAVMSQSWAIYKSRMGLAIGGFVLMWVLNQAVAYGSGFVGQIVMQNMGKAGIVVVVFAQLASYVFSIFLNLGLAKLMINIAGGRRAEIADLFSGGPHLIAGVLSGILFTLMIAVGLVLLIVPGIIVAMMFSQYLNLIVDKGVGTIDSLTLSKQLTDGNKMTLFLLGIVSFGVLMLGALACGIGIIFAFPYVFVLWAVAYLTMSGQPVARP